MVAPNVMLPSVLARQPVYAVPLKVKLNPSGKVNAVLTASKLPFPELAVMFAESCVPVIGVYVPKLCEKVEKPTWAINPTLNAQQVATNMANRPHHRVRRAGVGPVFRLLISYWFW